MKLQMTLFTEPLTAYPQEVRKKMLMNDISRTCFPYMGGYSDYDYCDGTVGKYVCKRTEQLKEQATFEELVDKVALYESELLDYAERLLSDDPLIADSETAMGTLEMLDNEAIDLFKSLDIDNDYQGLEY